jgi:poly-gamma-glutamate capsule biosynthesis protein CapA/YwtB (metallophosphatase superfamily)
MTLVVRAVGDIMLGSTYPDSRDMPPNDGKDILKKVTPLLQNADITFGNLEGPLVEGGVTGKKGANSYAFRTPPRYGRYLKEAGFDVLSVANNHANDFGERGRNTTCKTLEDLGIAHAGKDKSDVAYLTVQGTTIAVIAFAHNQVSLNINQIAPARQAVAEATRRADVVIVSFHGGAEGTAHQHVPRRTETYFGEARGNLPLFAHAVIDAGAELVLGHGPHVVRGMEFYKDRLIAYSLGNFATYGKFGLRGETALSLVLEVQLQDRRGKSPGAFVAGRIYPIVQVGKGVPQPDPEQRVIPVVQNLSRADFGKSAPVISKDGFLAMPNPAKKR